MQRRKRFVERMSTVIERCDQWAYFLRHVRQYWLSLDETEKRSHSAIGEGLAAMEVHVKACHGSTLVDTPEAGVVCLL